MTTTDLINTVNEYVNTADVRLLKLLKALAESYESDEDEAALSEEYYTILNNRRAAHNAGVSNSYTWEEVKNNARNAG